MSEKLSVQKGFQIDHGKTGEKFFGKYRDLQRFFKIA